MMTFLVISLSVTVVWLAILVIVLYQSRRDELHEARLRIAELEGRLIARRVWGSNLIRDTPINTTKFTGSHMTDAEVRAEIERLKRDLNIRGGIGH